MWFIGLRDLQWRRRRFLIATAATALVLGMTLVLAGISGGFRNEPVRAVRAIGADAWVVPRSELGPFTAATPLPAEEATAVASEPGVTQVEPLVLIHFATQGDHPRDINVVGYRLGGMVVPHVRSGRAVAASGEAVADERLGKKVGDTIAVGGHGVRIVGTVRGVSYFGGEPGFFIPIEDAQALAFAGRPLATALITRGRPTVVRPDLRVMTNSQAVADLRRPLKSAIQSVNSIGALLWVVAVGIVGSIAYVTALERVRDFAVMKAIGVANRDLAAGLAVQAVLVALAAAAVGVVIAEVLAPVFPLGVEIPRSSFVALPVVAVGVGLLASLAGLRRAVSVDPALAFAGA